MTLAIVTFLLCVGVMMGLYWAFIVRPENQRSRALARRVERMDAAPAAAGVTSVATPLTATSVIDALLAQNISLTAEVQRLLAEAGLSWTPSGLMTRTVIVGVIGAAIGAVWTGHRLGGGLGLITAALPYLYARRERSRRLRIFEEQFPEAIDLIARSLRAGHAFTTGLGIAAEEVPPPVGLEFRRVYDEQNFGMSLSDALKGMARRVPVLDARFFVTAVLTQREAGGNLAEVLDNLSSVMRDRFKVRRQIRVVSAHGRITAWVLTCLPPGLAAVLYTISPQFIRILFDDPLGIRLVAIAVGLQVLGTLIIAKLVQVEVLAMDALLLSIIFVAVGTGSAALLWHYTEPDATRRRLSEVVSGTVRPLSPQESVLSDAPSHLARRVRSFVPKSPQNMNHIQRMLASAGYHNEWAAIAFATVQLALPVLVFLFIVGTFGLGSPVLFGGIAAALTYYLPVFWLGSKIDARRREIRNGLPDATDLLIVCLEAGSGIDQALARVAEELEIAYPSLARELELIGSETRAGKPRMEAFKNFAERTKVDDVRSLVAMLVQTDRFGTSLGQALRTHADTSRTKRRQRAEERAAKLGVKLLFPLVLCLFPAFFTVVLGPSMVQIYRQFVLQLGQK